jgi:hypothetical protein
MSFSENRFPLFRDVLYRVKPEGMLFGIMH